MEFSPSSIVTFKAVELLLFSYEYCSPELTLKLLSALTSASQDSLDFDLDPNMEDLKKSLDELLEDLNAFGDLKYGISQVWDSLELLWRLREILKGQDLYWFKCIEALQFGNSIATHIQVIEGLDSVMMSLSPEMKCDIECLFAQWEVKDKLGLGFECLNQIREMLNDHHLYMDVLNRLTADSHLNWAWKQIFDDVSRLVYDNKPEISEELDMFLWDKYTNSMGDADRNQWYGEYCEHVYNQTEAIDTLELHRELSNLCITPTTPTFSSMV